MIINNAATIAKIIAATTNYRPYSLATRDTEWYYGYVDTTDGGFAKWRFQWDSYLHDTPPAMVFEGIDDPSEFGMLDIDIPVEKRLENMNTVWMERYQPYECNYFYGFELIYRFLPELEKLGIFFTKRDKVRFCTESEV